MKAGQLALLSSVMLMAVCPIPESSHAAVPLFTDVTDEAGLTDTPAFRLSVADINGDGYPDFVLHHSTDAAGGDVRNKQWVYLNVVGDVPTDPFSRKFIDYTTESGIRANRDATPDGRHTDGAIFADVDNDGDIDMFNTVYVHREHTMDTDRNDLLLNDGDGHFTLAPTSPFHTEALFNTPAAVFLDYDNNGNIDLFIGNWYAGDGILSYDQLYWGGGDGNFTNTSFWAGIRDFKTAVYGAGAWDWDNDGWQDIFAPSYSHVVSTAQSVHYQNNGDGTFTMIQSTSGFGQYTGGGSGRASFGSMPRDFDNDGDLDHFEILTHGAGDGSIGIHSTTVMNEGGVYVWDFARVDGRAAEDPDTTHHGDHYTTWADFDLDGLADFALTESGYDNNRFYVFQQSPDHTFAPVTVACGMNPINIADLPCHNAMALDYDRDGDEDLLVGFGSNSIGLQLWRNENGTDNSWIVVDLEGGGGSGYANRSAIGGKVAVDANSMTQTHWVHAGNGHQGPQGPLSLHFGLGSATNVDALTVHWPNADQTTRDFTDLLINRIYRIREICTVEDPVLKVVKRDNDIDLTWEEAVDVAWWWHLYRDEAVDPASWGAPLASYLDDGDLGTPGIQYTDVDAMLGAPLLFYQAAVVNDCGETPLF